MCEQVVQQQQAGQQQQEAAEATTAAVREVWERLERLDWNSGIWSREFIFLSDLKKFLEKLALGPGMRLGRYEGDLYQQQVKRQQQQQSAGIPNRMSLLEKAIAIVQKEGIQESRAMIISEAEHKSKHFFTGPKTMKAIRT
ncbi:MAG: hypothetical protein VW729_08620 [Deltaproteobacteria bacterium]